MSRPAPAPGDSPTLRRLLASDFGRRHPERAAAIAARAERPADSTPEKESALVD